MKDPVKDKLKRFGLFRRLGEERFFATVGEAVNRYVEAEKVEWDRLGGSSRDDPPTRAVAGGSAA